MSKTTTTVRAWGKSAKAYAERVRQQDGTERIAVRVYDDVAGHYTTCHSLTPAQVRYVAARTIVK